MAATTQGRFVISLDVELYWGLRDLLTKDEYRERYAREREVIPLVLQRFRQRRIHATWAVVGLMFAGNKSDMLSRLPAVRPAYHDMQLSPYPYLMHGDIGEDEREDPLHYGLSLIEQIQDTPHQRLGTHTFSHYYCKEPGESRAAFEADLQAALRAAQDRGWTLSSLVFPRNQVRTSYLSQLKQAGITSYRGNPEHWLYKRGYSTRDPWLYRGVRLLDHYMNVTGHHTSGLRPHPREEPLNVPASHFLKSYSGRLAWLEPLRLRRIKNAMTHAARHGLIYHLWLHPYNLVDDRHRNLYMLDKILGHYEQLHTEYGMQSCCMEEIPDEEQALRAELG